METITTCRSLIASASSICFKSSNSKWNEWLTGFIICMAFAVLKSLTDSWHKMPMNNNVQKTYEVIFIMNISRGLNQSTAMRCYKLLIQTCSFLNNKYTPFQCYRRFKGLLDNDNNTNIHVKCEHVRYPAIRWVIYRPKTYDTASRDVLISEHNCIRVNSIGFARSIQAFSNVLSRCEYLLSLSLLPSIVRTYLRIENGNGRSQLEADADVLHTHA